MRRLLWISSLAFLSGLFLVGLSAAFVEAADPPWPAGLPWPTSQPWPTPHPLQLGVPWSPGAPSYGAPAVAPYVPPAGPVYLPLAPPVNIAPPAYALPASTPLPPINLSVSTVQVVPPVPPAPASSPQAGVLPSIPQPSSVSSPPASAPVDVSAPGPAPVYPAPATPVANDASPALTSLLSAGTAADGLSRAAAFAADDSWRTMQAGGNAWFLIGSGSVHMDVWLDADPHLNVDLQVYAPNGASDPVGRGTFDHANPDRLVWSGGNWNADGNWYALVTNSNPVTLRYKIGSSQHEIGAKGCYSYWEYIGSAHVYWTKCQ